MVEVLIVFGFLSWLCMSFLQWLSALPSFPALVAGGILAPLLATKDYSSLIRNWRLHGLASKREPIPPERFYWTQQRRKLRRILAVHAFIALLCWMNVLLLPASAELTIPSGFGWANALLGIFFSTRSLSAGTLYYKASQWFDVEQPGLVGLVRHAMYKLSDNYEYLHPTKRDHEKESVY